MSPEEVFGRERINVIRHLHQTEMLEPLGQLEDERKLRWSTRYMWWALSGFLALTGSVMLGWDMFFSVRDFDDFGAPFAIGCLGVGCVLFGMFGIAGSEDFDIRHAIKKIVVLPVINQLGFKYEPYPFAAEVAGRATELGLLPKYDWLAGEDTISGTRSGLDFLMMDTQLIKRLKATKGPKQEQVFWGQCIQVTLDKPVHGKTSATRRRNLLSWRTRPKGLQKTDLISLDIRGKFQVRSSDQVEARYLMTPDLLERLSDLEKSLKGKRLRFGFIDRYLIIVVEKGDLFDPNLQLTKLQSDKVLNQTLKDISAIALLLDTLANERQRETA